MTWICASRRWLIRCLCLLAAALLSCRYAVAEPPAAAIPALPESAPDLFIRETAVAWALQNNPELAAIRQQHGIAAAAVVIANSYPFSPAWTNKLFAVNGPESSGITNRLAMEQRVTIDLELRGQGSYRRQAACAALSRTDWEIVNQETLLAVRVIRAFDNVIYQ